MRHEVDEFGDPLDPDLRQLEFHLADLAARWRGALSDPVHQDEIVHEYHETIHHLYQLGWDAELDLESHLPDRLMPDEYKKRNIKRTVPKSSEWVEPSKFFSRALC